MEQNTYFKDAEERNLAQENLNKKLAEFKQSQSGEDGARLEAVDEAIAILQKADVPFTAFFHTKHPDTNGKDRAIQYNNYSDTVKRRNKDEKYIGHLNSEFAFAILNMISAWIEVNGMTDKVDKQYHLNLWAREHMKTFKEWND